MNVVIATMLIVIGITCGLIVFVRVVNFGYGMMSVVLSPIFVTLAVIGDSILVTSFGFKIAIGIIGVITGLLIVLTIFILSVAEENNYDEY
jgi:hypothetical protein